MEPEEPDSLHTGANTWVWGGADTVLPCLAAGTLIIAPPGSWLRRDFINSITGLMTGPGTPWDESLEEQFTQVRGTGFFFFLTAVTYLYNMEQCVLFLISLFCDTCNFILITDS